MMPIQLSFESHSTDDLAMDQDVQDSVDAIVALKRQESLYTCCDYLSQQNLDVDENSRSKMVEWCYQTIDFFKLSRHSAHVAVSCLDRFLATSQGKPFLLDKTLYQLACITSLHLSIKVHESVELGLSMLVQLCRGVYTPEQILATEQTMLGALKWALNPPSPRCYLQHFITMLPRSVSNEARRKVFDVACYQTELALGDYNAGVLSPPSAVAVGSLMNALSLCKDISTSSSSLFFRRLGKATGCSRHMESVNGVKELMQHQIQISNMSSMDTEEDDVVSHSYERRASCGYRSKAYPEHTMGQDLSPVAVSMDTR